MCYVWHINKQNVERYYQCPNCFIERIKHFTYRKYSEHFTEETHTVFHMCTDIYKYRKIRHMVDRCMLSSPPPLTIYFIGFRTKACLTCSTCSSPTDVFPFTHDPVSWNCAYHLRMELSDAGCFSDLVRNCRWTVVNDWHSEHASTQNVSSLPFATILIMRHLA